MGDWWKYGVIYQVYPRSFQDTNGDGVGDLPGIIGRLDHLVWLGVDAVWISPIFLSPMEDFGYDIEDYTAVDPTFGTMEDFDKLVAESHRRGIKVVLDFVPNHTSREHPWFLESRFSKEGPKRGWYIWRDPKPDGLPPNNWRSQAEVGIEGSAWNWDERTGQYYLSNFAPTQPDLDWRNSRVREAMLDVLRFWLERGVDGFRIDMVDFLGKDERFRDEPPLPEGKSEKDYLSVAKYQLNRPETLDYIREMREVIHACPDRVMIGEVNYFLTIDELLSYYGEGDLLDLPFNFGLLFLPLEAPAIHEFVGAYDAALLSSGAWPNYSLGNHDVLRVSRHGEALSRLAAMLLLTLRGTPFVYYGDEIGMPNVDVPPERRRDPWITPETGLGRDPARTPMQWSGDPYAGFSKVETWLPVAPDYPKTNVEAQKGDPRSILNLYQRLLALRKETPALRSGAYEPVAGIPDGCFVFLRRREGRRFLVALNFSDEERTLRLPWAGEGQVLLSTRLDRENSEDLSDLRLRGEEGCIIEL